VLAGSLRLAGGSVIIAADGQRYRDIDADLTLTPGHMELRRLHVRSGEGEATASATATFAGWRPSTIDGHIEARDFAINAAGTTAAGLDGKLRFSAHASDGGLAGSVHVEEGALRLPSLSGKGKRLQPLGPLEDVVFVDAAAERERQRAEEARRTALPLDVDMQVPGGFALRGPEIEADLRGNLHVRVRGGVPSITGSLETDTGWVDLGGRRLHIDWIRLSFDGRTPVEAYLDVRLVQPHGDTTLIVQVHGSSKHPEITFASDPPVYGKSEVVGLLLGGDTSSVVDERSLDQKVVGALSGMVVNKLKSELLPSLPVDVLKVELGSEGYTGASTTRIEIGKYLSSQLYVSYVHQFGTLPGRVRVNSNQATVEWRFARHFQLDTTYGDAGVGGTDLVFKYRF
jgi:autotransporter translocation and assembly factor TamB